MNINVFKNLIGFLHELALTEALDMKVDAYVRRGGIDLLDKIKGIEVKGCLINSKSLDYKKRYAKWTLFDNQLSWGVDYDIPIYCAVGTYEMDTSIRKMRSTNLYKIESHVAKRNFKIVPWEWTERFPSREGVHHKYQYFRTNPSVKTGIPCIPKTIHNMPINKGSLHFTEGVDMEHFSNIL